MNLQFFPSRKIAAYMVRLFFLRSLSVLLALVLILMTLDLLGNSGEILAHAGNGEAELWRYVGLRVPQLVARFLPFSVLLGTLITLVTLNQNSEIVTMKAVGISAHQIVAPLVLAGLLIAVANFAFNERIVTRANAALSAWEAVDYGPVPASTDIQSNVRVQHGEDLIFVDQVVGAGEQTRLSGITIYDRTGGTLRRILEAETGARNAGGWQLRGARMFTVESGQLSQMESVQLGASLRPEQFTLAAVDPDEQDFWELRESIGAVAAAGRPTATLEASLWHKLSGPLSTVLMPLLAATAAFGLARSGQLFFRAVVGMALGFAYFVADNFALAMGNFGAYPPFLAAWGPFLLFLLVGEAVLIRTEE
ncbi:LPS export ABC transporter permease LptG [Sphingosinicella sp. CPCC 101087]|uniref:LPS export ABC transporter permease LptG n=1 Tax=Sphingosinicella sp. CPCC 101087 TaxID=2497754 RepID=UPI00101CB373|nr:LPS export ABC transporter permease LptG [Sphingosinicella sp. CPCC 101087]